MKFIDLTGLTIGRLKVLKVERHSGKIYWHCICNCGNKKTTTSAQLHSGHCRSCGCFHSDRVRATKTIHGATAGKHPTSEYRTWTSMKNRCSNPKSDNYKNYGGRGIKVCKQWINSFQSFLSDMGSRPVGKSLDRKDNNGDYTPSNCRWATKREQLNNKRGNVIISFEGQLKTITEWSNQIGIDRSCLYHRFHSGWPSDRIITEPVNARCL